MNSLDAFKEWCSDAFSFLKEYGFIEAPLPKDGFTNQYQVIFSKDDIELKILGEGYGRIASVLFVAPNGIEVPCGCLDKNSQLAKNVRKKGGVELSQREQIYSAAKFIATHLKPILLGDYTYLIEHGNHLFEQREKSRESLRKFINDPKARAERAAIVAISEAGHAFRNEQFKRVVELLEPHIKYLPPKQIERLEISKKQTQ